MKMISRNDEAEKKTEEHDRSDEGSESEANKIIPFSPLGARLREKLLGMIVPWEEVTVSLDNFPYYIEEQTKSLLVECVASHLKRNKLRKYGARLKSSSRRILLQSIPGIELYRERLVSALAREMQVPLLKLEGDEEEDKSDDKDSAEESDEEVNNNLSTLKEGDRVKYVGKTISIEEVNNRTLSNGRRGEVHEVNGKRVAVVFNICGLKTKESGEDEKIQKYWDELSLLGLMPKPLKDCIERLEVSSPSEESGMQKLFPNIVCIKPPMDEDLLKTFVKQIEADRLTVISEGNLKRIHKVLEDHNLSCKNLENPNVQDMILTRQKAEQIVGRATNHYLSSCPLPCVNAEKLDIPYDSIKLAISRLMEEESHKQSGEQPKSLEDLADCCQEKSFLSAVIRSEDIRLKFDDVGALENVKKLLYETVILPMKRPELFSRGNLLTPCKGILLFGPPGTGKTLMGKALATESGANFINITAASITSMWEGETEQLMRALFSYATKLTPVIIFIYEVDSLLAARGQTKHDTSRLNEFMAAWDGLTSKDSQRILVIGATNRPFDLDEAVIRRMPRRIYVGLPEVDHRCKILKILLKEENLEPSFSFEQLAEATEGYSGSDLKNLCVAAAYRLLEEFLEHESKGGATDGVPALRPLSLNDFIHSKSKVRPSVAVNASSIIKLEKWREKYGERESQAENSTI